MKLVRLTAVTFCFTLLIFVQQKTALAAEKQIYPDNPSSGSKIQYNYSLQSTKSGQCFDASPYQNEESIIQAEGDGTKTYRQSVGVWYTPYQGDGCQANDWGTNGDNSLNAPAGRGVDAAWVSQQIKIPANITKINRVKFYQIFTYWTWQPYFKLSLYNGSTKLYETSVRNLVIQYGPEWWGPYEFSGLNWNVNAGTTYEIRLERTDGGSIALPLLSPCKGGWYSDGGHYECTWWVYDDWRKLYSAQEDANQWSPKTHNTVDGYTSGAANSPSSKFGDIAKTGGVIKADIARAAVWGEENPLPAPGNPASFCNDAGTAATLTWNAVSGADAYLIRANNTTNGWMDIYDFSATVKASLVCPSSGCSFTTGVSDALPDRDVAYCATSPCSSFTGGPANIVTGHPYNWSVQAIAPSESYPYSGAYAGGNFTCTPGTPGIGSLTIKEDTANGGVVGSRYGISGLTTAEGGSNYYNTLSVTQNITNSSSAALEGVAFVTKGGSYNNLSNLISSAGSGSGNFILLYATPNCNPSCTAGGQTFYRDKYYVYFDGGLGGPLVPVGDPYLSSGNIRVRIPTTSTRDNPQFSVTFFKNLGSHNWGTYGYVRNNSNGAETVTVKQACNGAGSCY